MSLLLNIFRCRVARPLAGCSGLLAIMALPVQASPPTGILLSGAQITENAPNGTLVGALSAVDTDSGDSHTFDLVSGAESWGNQGFVISGNQLSLNYPAHRAEGAFLDFEKHPTYSIRVSVTDSTGQSFEKNFVIVMSDDQGEDADYDGLIESVEDGYLTSDVLCDSDGDGFTDPIEILKNSSPTNSSAWPDYPLVGWGSNSVGELRTPDSAGFSTLSTGQDHSLGLNPNGTIAAWAGYNEYGQTTVPAGLGSVVAVAAGGDDWWDDTAHSLALKSDGTVVAWGYDAEGALTPPVGLAGVVEIATGRVHSLVLKSDGTVATWGGNHYGQCAVPAGLGGVVAISAGGFYSMALKSDGSVVSWGGIFNGESWEAVTVPQGLSDVVAISAGRFHSMALKSDGSVVCWGYNLDGQTNVPVDLSGVVAIEAGGFHSLALRSNGSVVAWGSNRAGETTVPPSANIGVRAISAGLQHSFALRTAVGDAQITSPAEISAAPGAVLNHQVVVSNAVPTQFKALGLPDGLVLDSLTGIVSGTVSGAARQSVRIQVDTPQGRLTQVLWIHVFQGLPPTAISLSPAIVTENSPANTEVGIFLATDPDPGDSHVFELVDGSGSQDNGYFRISDGRLIVNQQIVRDYEQSTAPFSIRVRVRDRSLNFYETIRQVYLADDLEEDADGDGLSESDEALAGTSDLTSDTDDDGFGDGFELDREAEPANATNFPSDPIVLGWGRNDYGQTSVPSSLGEIAALAAGWEHTLALKSDQTVVAWGMNDVGQCVVPSGLTGAVAIAAGGYHNLVLKSNGSVVAWGGNEYGQATVPETLGGVVAIAAGKYHSLALKGDGTVVAWGNQEDGQSSVPPGLGGVVAIAAGGFHSLALKSDGSVVAWGAEWSGAVTVPAGLERIVAIAAGGFHSLALMSNGTVVAWGDNEVGQRVTPQGLGDVTEIRAGWLHSVALKRDGSLVSWGGDGDGQRQVPLEARKVQLLAAGGFHNVGLRQTTGFPQVLPVQAVVGWPGQTLSHQVLVSGATSSHFTALGLPDGLTIDPDTGLISGSIVNGQRRASWISVDTDKGRLSRMLWFNTVDGSPPTAIILAGDPLSLLENRPNGTVVAALSAVDPDLGDIHTFNVRVIAGSPNPYCLTAVGGDLVVLSGEDIDFDSGSGLLTIRVRVSDSGSNEYEQDFTIQLVNDRTEDWDEDGVSEATEEDVLFTRDDEFNEFGEDDGDEDGISTLLEYAFNLNPQVSDAGHYLGDEGSLSGLPWIHEIVDGQGQRRLRMEYIRRIGSGLSYVPEFASSLSPGSWRTPTRAIEIIWINSKLERCVIDDYEFTPSPATRFGRIGVYISGPATGLGHPPTAITLSRITPPAGPITLMENPPANTVVGLLGVVDPDPGDTHGIDVTVINGSANSGDFSVVGDQLVVASGAVIDFESGTANLAVRVTATDSSLNEYWQDFVIQLIDDRTEDADGDGVSESLEEDAFFTSDRYYDDFRTADGDNDGVPTLIEYAFNLNPQAADAGDYLGGAGSLSGLPLVHMMMGLAGESKLRIEYLERIGSGMSYVPQFSSSLNSGDWVSGTEPIQIIPINGQWQRCVIDDANLPVGPVRRFGRVRVSKD